MGRAIGLWPILQNQKSATSTNNYVRVKTKRTEKNLQQKKRKTAML